MDGGNSSGGTVANIESCCMGNPISVKSGIPKPRRWVKNVTQMVVVTVDNRAAFRTHILVLAGTVNPLFSPLR